MKNYWAAAAAAVVVVVLRVEWLSEGPVPLVVGLLYCSSVVQMAAVVGVAAFGHKTLAAPEQKESAVAAVVAVVVVAFVACTFAVVVVVDIVAFAVAMVVAVSTVVGPLFGASVMLGCIRDAVSRSPSAVVASRIGSFLFSVCYYLKRYIKEKKILLKVSTNKQTSTLEHSQMQTVQ